MFGTKLANLADAFAERGEICLDGRVACASLVRDLHCGSWNSIIAPPVIVLGRTCRRFLRRLSATP